LISEEPRGEESIVVVITRGGIVTGEDRVTLGKTTEGSGIIRVAEKTQLFDPRRERHTFEEARKEFVAGQASSSKAQPKVRECGIPPSFDQSARKGKEVSKLMEFLYTCINLIKDEKVVQELQHLVRQHEIGRIDPILSRVVNQLSRKIRINKELHVSAQIGDYDVDYVVLDLGSEVNVMTKQTWALMGKPRLIYSPIRLMMANQ
jgi:hypothetical protein